MIESRIATHFHFHFLIRIFPNYAECRILKLISYIIYQFNYVGCRDSYIGKTERKLCTRKDEDACRDKENAIYKHINNCSYLDYNQVLLHFSNDSFDKALFDIISVQSNNQARHGNPELKTKLSIMASFFELITRNFYILYKNPS